MSTPDKNEPMTDPGAHTSPPIFIIGSPRSGTTLMRVILDSHPQISAGPETHFLVRLHRLADRNWGQVERFGVERDYWDGLAHDFFQAVHVDYMLRRGRTRWVEKTPSYTLHLDYIDRLFPDAQYLHVLRDGRDVVASHRDRWGYRNSVTSVNTWVTHVRAAREFSRGPAAPRFHEIRYEDLVRAPEETLRPVFEFLGEPWDAGVLAFNKKEHDISRYDAFTAERRAEGGDDVAIYASRVGAGDERLDRFLRGVLHLRGGRLLRELGYT